VLYRGEAEKSLEILAFFVSHSSQSGAICRVRPAISAGTGKSCRVGAWLGQIRSRTILPPGAKSMVRKSLLQSGTGLEMTGMGKMPKSLLFHTRTERPK